MIDDIRKGLISVLTTRKDTLIQFAWYVAIAFVASGIGVIITAQLGE